ncbi:MAG: cysteine synthase A, partial [Psychroserpens sp.]
DGIVLGSSSALNVAGAIRAAAASGPGKTIVTFACDVGERSFSKLYNQEFLQEKSFPVENESVAALFKRYQTQSMDGVVTV